MDDLEKQWGTFSVLHQASFQTHWWIQTAVTVQKCSIWVKIGDFLSCVTLKFDRWPWKTIGHLFYATSKPSVNSNWSDSPETLNSAKNQRYLARLTVKFHGWPWKTIGRLFYATSIIMHHFIAICEFKLEIQSKNAQFGSKSTIFLAAWPWNLTDDLENQ